MTGDGVNDVLALKDADCSVAMASGSDAASNVAQLVLLDSDFTRMPSVVAEGRRVVNNIERTASLYIVKNIFSMLLAIFSVILMLDYPLEPSQVSLISMFTIGIPSFILALEPNKNPIRGRFLTNVLILQGIFCGSGLSFYILYDSCGNRWIYDFVSHCKANEYRPYHYDDRCGCRLAVLYAICK